MHHRDKLFFIDHMFFFYYIMCYCIYLVYGGVKCTCTHDGLRLVDIFMANSVIKTEY